MDNTTAVYVETLTHEDYEGYIFLLCLVANLALFLYSNLLAITQEVEYIWLRQFSLPSLLYIFARYGSLLAQAMNVVVGFLPPGRACNIYYNAADSIDVFAYIGTQGLLVARAYSLCKGHEITVGLLALTFFSTLVLYLFQIISFPQCFITQTDEANLLSLLINISVIMNAVVVHGICWWNVWKIWQMKRQAGLRNGHSDLASILLEQIVTQFSFVVLFTITTAIISIAPQTKNLDSTASFIIFQKTLSAVLLSEFTLSLRQRNSTWIAASNVSLPTLQIQSVLQHIHESFVVELGDNNNNIRSVDAEDNGPDFGSVSADCPGDFVQDQSESAEAIVSATA